VNLANELPKITFSKFSVKSFLAKALNDHLSNLITHSRQYSSEQEWNTLMWSWTHRIHLR